MLQICKCYRNLLTYLVLLSVILIGLPFHFLMIIFRIVDAESRTMVLESKASVIPIWNGKLRPLSSTYHPSNAYFPILETDGLIRDFHPLERIVDAPTAVIEACVLHVQISTVVEGPSPVGKLLCSAMSTFPRTCLQSIDCIWESTYWGSHETDSEQLNRTR